MYGTISHCMVPKVSVIVNVRWLMANNVRFQGNFLRLMNGGNGVFFIIPSHDEVASEAWMNVIILIVLAILKLT